MPARRSIVLVLALSVGACSKKKAVPDAASPPEPPVLDVASLPAQTRVIMGISVPDVASSPLARRVIGDALARDPDAKRRLTGLVSRCHLHVAEDIDSVTIAMAEPSQVAVMARGDVDEEALLSCLRAEMVSAGGTVRDLRVGGHVAYAIESKDNLQKVWMAVGAHHTLLVSTDLAWLDRIIDASSPRLDAATRALLGRVDRSAAVWGVGRVPASTGEQLVKLTAGAVARPARTIEFDVGLEGGLALRLRMDMASASDAEQLARFARSQLGLLAVAAQRYGLGQLASKTRISNDGASCELSLRLDDSELRRLETALLNQKEQAK